MREREEREVREREVREREEREVRETERERRERRETERGERTEEREERERERIACIINLDIINLVATYDLDWLYWASRLECLFELIFSPKTNVVGTIRTISM